MADFLAKLISPSSVAGWALVVLIFLAVLFVVLSIVSMINNRKKQHPVKEGYLWQDRKHTFLGLPWSFTVYSLTEERLFVKTGLFNTVENEARLYRILDIQLRRTLKQRILGLGTIALVSSDKSLGNFLVINVPHPVEVKELISQNVEKQRKENRVSNREIMSVDSDDDVDDNDEDNQ